MEENKVDQYYVHLSAQITDVFLRVEALRVLLQDSGLIDPARFESELERLKEKYTSALQQRLLDSLETQKQKLGRAVLELHEGIEQ
jgi:hypothetical protein